MADPSSVETVAHVIQLALTPVFLLSGVATLLNVFAQRLGRIADQVDALKARLAHAPGGEAFAADRVQFAYLNRRSRALDGAVLLGALAGAATCGATLALFVGVIRGAGAAWLLFSLFGAAVILTIGALGCFCYEMLLASRGLRIRALERPARPL
jgi:hypothetical protein